MGELRVFYNLKDCKFDLWKHLGLSKGMPEKRTDIYFNLCDKRFGLKLRDKTVIELKELQKVDSTTQVEKWAKTIHTYFPTSIKDVNNWTQELTPILGKSATSQIITQLLSGFDHSKLISIQKSRISSFLNLENHKLPPPANKGSCHAEQADIVLEINGNKETYRSICFEGDTRVLKIAMDAVCAHLQGHIVCGYPEFVHIVCKAT